MPENPLPLTKVVTHLHSYGLDRFEDFQAHVEPLNINASGDVLIIGPALWLEEMAIIESEIANQTVTSLTIIGEHRVGTTASIPLKTFKENYQIPLEISGVNYGQLFQRKPVLLFDTIMFIGTIMSRPEKSLPYLANQLKPGGRLYATINAITPPTNLPEIENCTAVLIPNIPNNPNYNYFSYYGVVIEKTRF